MMALEDIGRKLDAHSNTPIERMEALDLLRSAEAVLEHWLVAHNLEPTHETVEGSRLLALHRQGARADPTFNACRETCREIAYHFNVLTVKSEGKALLMMRLVVNHLFLFVSGKLEIPKLGDFCCASKPLRLNSEDRKE